MKIWHDWEFLEKGNSVYPISVGMVTDDGHELYYEFSEAPWGMIRDHEWLMENVVPNLASYSFTTSYIQERVYEFLKKAMFRDSKNYLELWGWYSSYDHVCLGQLFGAMVNLPAFVPMYTKDLKQEADRLDVRIPDLRQPGEIEHNALHDARVERRMGEWLIGYESGKPTVTIKDSSNVQVGHGNTQVNSYSDKPKMGFGEDDDPKRVPWYRDPKSMEH